MSRRILEPVISFTMAPQGSKTGPKSTMDNDAFLARCIKHSKEKINVDWEAFSRDTGMSVGGAR